MGAREGMTRHLSYRKPFYRLFSTALLIFLAHASPPLGAQERGDPSTSPQGPAAGTLDAAKPKADNASEISQTETAATFKVRVNLVQVRVIVRDPSGKAIDNLAKQDFLLYDQGKLQLISNFSVETPQSRMQRATDAAKSQDAAGVETSAAKAPVLPERFVGVVFDDLHLSQQDATFVRQQAGRFLDSIGPTDRVAIFSTS